jgi:YihY family inner membrane protein
MIFEWLKKTGRRFWEVTWNAFEIFFEIEGGHRAASFAYYALFSLVPLFALLLTIGSAFVRPDEVISTVEKFFPMEAAQQELVWKMAATLQSTRGGVSTVAMLVFVWGSMRFFEVLVQGVNRAWHRVLLPWWKLPFKNLGMMLVIASALGFGLFAPVVLQAGERAVRSFDSFLEQLIPGIHFEVLALVFSGARFLLAGGLMIYALSALYMLAPGSRIYLRQVWLPSLSVALALQLGQSLFGTYVTKFVNYNAIYGPVGAIMLTLMWVYVAGVIILLGGCYCAAGAGVRPGDATTPTTA